MVNLCCDIKNSLMNRHIGEFITRMRQNIFSSRKEHGCSMVSVLCDICMNVVCAYGMDEGAYVWYTIHMY